MHRLLIISFVMLIAIGCTSTDTPVDPKATDIMEADFVHSAQSGYSPGEAIEFVSTSTPDLFGPPVHIWNWGDGSDPETTVQGSATHVFPDTGLYYVTLTLQNSRGGTASITKPVGVQTLTFAIPK